MKLKLYLMGSGPIAVPIFNKLYASDKFQIVGICSQEDKPAGRSKKLTPTPVGIWAMNNFIPIEKVDSVNSEEFLASLRGKNPDMVLVVSFGQLLKEQILKTPIFGCINVHSSLLPKYRGASPVTAAILNGDSRTGVSIMQMEKGLDTGPVYRELVYELKGNEKGNELEIELGELTADYIEETLFDIFTGAASGVLQDHSKATKVSKIKKSDGMIDWDNMTSEHIERMVRAYYPWPGAYTSIQTAKGIKKIIITSASCAVSKTSFPGRIEEADKNGFVIGASGDTVLRILRLIPEGKKEMSFEEFLRGTQVELFSQCSILG